MLPGQVSNALSDHERIPSSLLVIDNLIILFLSLW